MCLKRTQILLQSVGDDCAASRLSTEHCSVGWGGEGKDGMGFEIWLNSAIILVKVLRMN